MAMRKLLMRWLMLALSSTKPNWTLDQLLCTWQLKVTMPKLFTLCCRMGQTQTRPGQLMGQHPWFSQLRMARSCQYACWCWSWHRQSQDQHWSHAIVHRGSKWSRGCCSLAASGADTNKARALEGQNPLLETAGSNSVARLAPCEKGSRLPCISVSVDLEREHRYTMSADLFGVISLSRPGFTIHNPMNEIKVFSPSNKSIAFHSDCVVSLLVSTKHIVYVYNY